MYRISSAPTLTIGPEYVGKHRRPEPSGWPTVSPTSISHATQCCCPWRDDPQAGGKTWGWGGFCPVHSWRC